MSKLKAANSWISFTLDSRNYDDVTLFGDLSDDGYPKSMHNKLVMQEASALYRKRITQLEIELEAYIITKLDYNLSKG